MADVQGLLSDPRFQGLDEASQLKTLGQVDSRFSSLTPDQFKEFKQKVGKSPRHAPRGSIGGSGPGGTPSAEHDTSFGGRMASGASRALLGETGGGPGETLTAPIRHPIETVKGIPDMFTPEGLGGALALAPFAAATGAGLRSTGVPAPSVPRPAQVAGKTASNFYKTPGKIKNFSSVTRQAYKDAVESVDLRKASKAATERFKKFTADAPKTPATPVAAPEVPKTGSGRPLTEDEIAFQNAPKVEVESEVPDVLRVKLLKEARTPAARIDPSPSRPADLTPIKPPEGYTRRSPIKGAKSPRPPAARVEPSSPQTTDLTPIKSDLPSGRKVPSSSERLARSESSIPSEADLPVVGKPKRAPRSDPAAQQRSDEIASLNRHADTVPLAQQTVKDGVTSKQLLELSPEQRAVFMKKIGLEGRSDQTWRTFVGHVLRLERLSKTL